MNPLLFLGLLAVGINYGVPLLDDNWGKIVSRIYPLVDGIYYTVYPPKAETRTTLAEEIIVRNEAKKEEREQRTEDVRGKNQYDWVEI